MCGIFGILRTNGASVSEREIGLCLDAIAHRGPDGAGIVIRGKAGLGHRRLSIIDLEGGRQPMSNASEDLWITFNGEIYNYKELRAELEARGFRFRTQSDTEVIIYAYQQWGEACVERFRGMFAFAILDERKGSIFLARDHLGIKPLYYLEAPGIFAFSSEIQALRRLPGRTFSLDVRAIDQYLQLQYIPAPRTAFREIRKLPPGHRMSVSYAGNVAGPSGYWDLRFRPAPAMKVEEWEEVLDQALRESVRAHLVADVPFGAFLSGGVDSSGIVAYMAAILNRPVQTFSIGFREEEYNELKYARIVAERWGTEHHEEIIEPDALAVLPDLVRHYGEPFGDSSALPTYYVCRMARRHVPMVLSGDGGDEAFAGYATYAQWLDWMEGAPMSWGDRWRSLKLALRGDPLPTRRANMNSWLRFVGYMPISLRKRLWRREHLRDVGLPTEALAGAFASAESLPPLCKAQYADFKTYLPGDILTKVDIASMMHGLEARTPLVDVRIAELAASMPPGITLVRDGSGGREGKDILKRTLERYYPRDFLRRPKKGFAVPLSKWFARGAGELDRLRERLKSRDSGLGDLFQPEAVASLVGSQAHGLVWLLLFLDEWLRQNHADIKY